MSDELGKLFKSEDLASDPVLNKVKPILDILTTIFPLAGPLSVIWQQVLEINNNSFQKKFKLIQQEIISGKKFITTEELSQSDTFENFNRLLQTVSRTNINEKIEFATRLFIRGCISIKPISTDLYEEYLHIIEDISLREILILSVLFSIESKYEHLKNVKHGEYLPSKYWDEFKKKVDSELGIQQELVYPIMKRLERTGLFVMFNGFSVGRVECGETTEYFRNFFRYITSFSDVNDL